MRKKKIPEKKLVVKEPSTEEIKYDLRDEIPKPKTVLTILNIQVMSVIQLHALIRNEYPQYNELLDIYNRDVLQNELIKKLGL